MQPAAQCPLASVENTIHVKKAHVAEDTSNLRDDVQDNALFVSSTDSWNSPTQVIHGSGPVGEVAHDETPGLIDAQQTSATHSQSRGERQTVLASNSITRYMGAWFRIRRSSCW